MTRTCITVALSVSHTIGIPTYVYIVNWILSLPYSISVNVAYMN